MVNLLTYGLIVDKFKYENSDIHLSYNQARALPEDTIRLWLDAISDQIPESKINTIVDVGCGTGRFTEPLSAHFSARTIGLEPSPNMLGVAAASKSHPLVNYIQGPAENIPLLGETADLLFLSMVYHHFRDHDQVAAEFHRVLKPGGFLCIRTSMREQLDSYLWMDFFPTARDIDVKRIPTKDSLITTMEAAGFKLTNHSVLKQRFAENSMEYLEKIKLRGVSSLKQISDDEFQQGLLKFEEFCLEQDAEKSIPEDISLFIFQAPNGEMD